MFLLRPSERAEDDLEEGGLDRLLELELAEGGRLDASVLFERVSE